MAVITLEEVIAAAELFLKAQVVPMMQSGNEGILFPDGTKILMPAMVPVLFGGPFVDARISIVGIEPWVGPPPTIKQRARLVQEVAILTMKEILLRGAVVYNILKVVVDPDCIYVGYMM